MMARKSNEFEKSFQQLETIVKRLESEELPLDESLQLFEEGVRLSRFCNQKLEEVEKKIEALGQFRTDLRLNIKRFEHWFEQENHREKDEKRD